MRRLIVEPPALADQRKILKHSSKQFGASAQRAYEALIRRAYRALRADPKRAGVVVSDELQQGLALFHLRHARTRGVSPKQARHIIVFTYDDATLTILRVLHDSMDISQRTSDEQS